MLPKVGFISIALQTSEPEVQVKLSTTSVKSFVGHEGYVCLLPVV